MILELHAPPRNARQVITEMPDATIIESTIQQQPWTDITFVVLRIDKKNWFEVSGSLSPRDGLSASYSEDGKEYVSNGPPESLQHCIALMQSYFNQDDIWRTSINWH